jgi:DNA-binding transcriptional regulator YiaG
MNAINTYPSAWFVPSALTGASRALVAVVLATVVSTAGTGGSNDAPLMKDRLVNGHKYLTHSSQSRLESTARDVMECVLKIREFFSPSVSNLAATLGVSRQTVYNWQNGEQPKEALAEKLSDLARAADVLAQSNIQFSNLLARRKFANGKTLFQIVEANESATEAAKLLAKILQTETRQRQILEARFASRPKTAPTEDFDLPIVDYPS